MTQLNYPKKTSCLLLKLKISKFKKTSKSTFRSKSIIGFMTIKKMNNMMMFFMILKNARKHISKK